MTFNVKLYIVMMLGIINVSRIDAQQVAPLAGSVPSDKFTVGVGTHFGQAREPQKELISILKQASVDSIRDEAYWWCVEPKKGTFQMPELCESFVRLTSEKGISALFVLGYGSFFYNNNGPPVTDESREAYAKYCEFVVRHFKGKIHRYEVWNEWIFSLEDYVKLLKTVYPRIKAIDPECEVIGGWTIGDYLDKIIELGGLKYLDGISIHAYPYNAGSGRYLPEGWIEWARLADKALAKASPEKMIPFYVTETSWPTQIAADGTPPELTAAYLARMYLLARSIPRLGGIYYYDLQNDGPDAKNTEHNFGLIDVDMMPKPAYYALRDVADLVATGKYIGRVPTNDPDVWIVKYIRHDGKDVWAFWSGHNDHLWRITLQSDQTNPEPMELQKIGTSPVIRNWGSVTWPDSSDVKFIPNQMNITVGPTPWLLIGNLKGVTVAAQVNQREFPENDRPTKLTMHLPKEVVFATPKASNEVKEISLSSQEKTLGVQTLDSFESVKGWSVGGSNHGPKTTIKAVSDPVAVGKGAAKLTYDFVGVKNTLNLCDYVKTMPLPENAKTLNFRLKGDGSGNSLWVRLVDKTGQRFSYHLGNTNVKEWTVFSLPLDKPAASHWDGANDGTYHYPLSFDSITIESAEKSVASSGSLFIDELAVDVEKAGTSKDLSASFRVQWDTDHLYLILNVTDNVHVQNASLAELWRDDSIQIALQALPSEGSIPQTYTELTMALTKTGPKVFRHSSQVGKESGLMTSIPVKIDRQGDQTRYELTLPVAEVDLPKLKAGTAIGLSLLFNDNDGQERKYLPWGQGIANDKNPMGFNWIMVSP